MTNWQAGVSLVVFLPTRIHNEFIHEKPRARLEKWL